MKPILIALVALCAAGAAAQTVVSLGVASTGNNFPFNTGGGIYPATGMRYQVIYAANEINLPLGAELTEIRVRKANGSIPTYNNFRLRLGHTSVAPTALTITYDSNYQAALTTVIGDPALPGTSPVNLSPASVTVGGVEWVRFPFTTNFVYNGISNILVDWSMDSSSGPGWTVAGTGRLRNWLIGANASTVTASNTDNGGNWAIEMYFNVGPGLAVAVTPGVSQTVYSNEGGPGGNGLQVGTFTITSNNSAGATLTNLRLAATGSGNDATAYTSVAVYREDNATAGYQSGDVLVATAPAFSADDGFIDYAIPVTEQQFAVNEPRTYYIVVRLNGTAQPGATFNYTIADITVGTGVLKTGVPSATINGLQIVPPVFYFADASAPAPVTAFLNSTGGICQKFTISYPNGPAGRPDSITVSGFGTGNEVADIAAAKLWHDVDNDGALTAADTLLDTQVFTLDNGTVTFGLAGHPVMTSGALRTYFVAYDLGASAAHQATFQCFISAATSAQGATFSGLPAPGVTGTPGLIVNANLLSATLNGPIVPLLAVSNETGPTGDGALLCDVTLTATPGAAWSLVSLQFTVSGTGSASTAFLEAAVHEDNGNGAWEGAATDPPAAQVAAGFAGGSATFVLTNGALNAGASRRFLLVGKLNGTPVSGQTFLARLQAVNAVPPVGGTTAGIPTADAPALVIDTATLVVTAGPAHPPYALHVAGVPAGYVTAQFRLYGYNSITTVTGITLTCSGSGDWATDVASTNGIEVYADNGDGQFSAATDSLLFAGGGGPLVNAVFVAPLAVPNAGHADIWVQVNLLDTAGAGVAAPPETFVVAIASPGDVATSSAVVLGSPAPASVVLGAIDFFVTTFQPVADTTSGGKPITIIGSGFMAPFVLRIGGVVCPGTPVISGGTQVTGLTVPAGAGTGLPITIQSGNLPTQTLLQTFTYSNVSTGGGGGSGGGGGCIAAPAAALWPMLVLLTATAWRRRRIQAIRITLEFPGRA